MEYDGAVILISHDRHLVEATADRLWIVKDGTVRAYDGDMESYRAELLAERGNKRKDATKINDDDAGLSRVDVRRAAADRRAQVAPLRKAMQSAENLVEKLSAEVAQRDAVLANSAIYTRDPQKAQRAALERGQLAKQLAEAEESWLLATEAFETANSGG